MKTLTVFTPTYNRAELLKTAYNSLCNQSCNDFKWLIVDGRSSDNTFEVVQNMIKENVIEIEYIVNPDRSKYTAMTKCTLPILDTPLIIFLDSDDYLSPDAVEIIVQNHINHKEDKEVAGYIYLCEYIKSNYTVKELNNGEKLKEIDLELRRKDKVDTCCQVYKSEVLKKYTFPDFHEKFTPESVIWLRIDKDYSIMTFNKIIYYREYLMDGSTKEGRKKLFESPLSAMESKKYLMNRKLPLKIKTKANISFVMYGLSAGLGVCKILKTSPNQLFSIIFTPIAFCLYKYYRRKYELTVKKNIHSQ